MDWLTYIILGFVAEIIDGCLGMAYGVFLTTCLATTGLSFVTISAGVHGAEVFTTLASGLSHLKFGNVNKSLLKSLLLPGIIGGILGACTLKFFDGEVLKPIVSAYLLVLGVRIFVRAYKKSSAGNKKTPRYLKILGFFGGYFDAVGGGGWGPIVTSSLIAKGTTPRETIGTVNLAEFFVTLVQSMTFILLIGLAPWKLIAGLMIGGIPAAPIAAWMCRKVDQNTMMFVVAGVIVFLNTYALIKIIAGL